ncbi:SRPBCC family protein [Gynurincola endophyticus]|uniref:SRPBCC family protein n=1 Tax=Gynurincola endophyticus TaxID=2479004 RepID=UPI000F8F299B|nr:SRPBCC domain-containing protein [Gynurincola endophyticus]
MSTNLLFDFSVNKENNTVNIKRAFNADIELVWEAWTNAEVLDQWWAPKPLQSKTKIMDCTVGGRRFYAMVNSEGQEHWGIQQFTLINPTTHLNWLSSFADKDENINTALPTSQWELNLIEQNETTIADITIRHQTFANIEMLLQMGFKDGFTMTLNELDTLLSALKK